MERLVKLLKEARDQGCSDIHVSEGLGIAARLHGKLKPWEAHSDSEERRDIIEEMCRACETGDPYAGDLDFALELEDGTRHRVNVYRDRTGLSAAIRLLNDHIPSLGELELPEVLGRLAEEPRGIG